MKKTIKLALLAAVLFICCSATSYAQKFAYVNSDEIIWSMPEIQQINENLTKLQNDHMEQLDNIMVEFNTKYEDFNKNAASYTEAVKQMKNKELQDIENRFQEYQQMAKEELDRAQQEMLRPVYEKASNAVKKVGIDNGFTMIFDLASGAVAYFDENTTVNATPLVKQALGIQ